MKSDCGFVFRPNGHFSYTFLGSMDHTQEYLSWETLPIAYLLILALFTKTGFR